MTNRFPGVRFQLDPLGGYTVLSWVDGPARACVKATGPLVGVLVSARAKTIGHLLREVLAQYTYRDMWEMAVRCAWVPDLCACDHAAAPLIASDRGPAADARQPVGQAPIEAPDAERRCAVRADETLPGIEHAEALASLAGFDSARVISEAAQMRDAVERLVQATSLYLPALRASLT